MTEAHIDNPWADRYARERDRLLAALGATTTGGVIEASAHVGSTSVPGLAGAACVDLALSARGWL